MYSCLNGNTRKEIYYKSMFCRKWFSILLVFQYGHTSRTSFCSLISILILSPTSSDLVIRSQETVISFCRRILMKPFLSSSFNDLYCHLYRMRNVKCTSIKYFCNCLVASRQTSDAMGFLTYDIAKSYL